MSGEEIKNKLKQGGISTKVTDLATKLNTTPQNISRAFSVADVKTGFLEKLCSTLNIDMTFFYGNSEYLPLSKYNDNSQNVPKFLYDEMKEERDEYKLRYTLLQRQLNSLEFNEMEKIKNSVL